MASLTRRNFLQAGGAAAGAAVLVGPLAHGSVAAIAAPASTGRPESQTEALEPFGTEHLVMVIRNPSKGEVAILTEGNEVIFNDPQLIARVQRAMNRKAL